VERLQQMAERRRVARRHLVQEAHDGDRLALVFLLARQLREPHQPDGCARATRGDRRVLDVLAAGDQGLSVRGRREEAALLGIGEAGDHLVGQPRGGVEEAHLAGRFEQRYQRLEQEGMVLQVGVDLGPAVVVGAQQPAALRTQVSQHELGAGDGRLDIARLRQRRTGLGQGGDHQRVPARQPLVIESRAHAAFAYLQQACPDAGPRGLVRGPGSAAVLQHVQARLRIVRVDEVPLLACPEPLDRRLGVLLQDISELGHRPDVEAPLGALGVGVERCVEAALRAAHLAQCPLERVRTDLAQGRLVEGLRAVEVRAGQQRVVVEHLLEVRDRPRLVHAVAREATADLVVYASGRHRAQRRERHLTLAAEQQELDHGRLRELRRAAEAAVTHVEGLPQPAHRRIELALRNRLRGGTQPGRPGQPPAQALASGADLLAVLLPGLGDRLQHLRPRRHPMAGVRWEVGAAVEGQLLGGEEHVQRPPAVAGHSLDGLHVDRVDVRALLAVHLHAHEAVVHQLGRARILEGLPLHHVTPVAGGVADRDQQRLVLAARPLERLRAPRQPVDRVPGMLSQIR
jgi:hypothetical protein